jgi:hypothetical protein
VLESREPPHPASSSDAAASSVTNFFMGAHPNPAIVVPAASDMPRIVTPSQAVVA